MSVDFPKTPTEAGSKGQLQEYLVASGAGLVVMILLSGIAELLGLDGISNVLTPGMFLAAIVFPEGAHSSWAMIYIVAALIIDALFLGGPIWWFWSRFLKRSRSELSK